MLGNRASGRLQVAKAAYAVRDRTHDAISYLQLDAAGLPSRLARLAGSEGWWFVYKFELSGLKPEEKLVHLVLVRERDGGFRALPVPDGAHFVKLAAKAEKRRQPEAVSVTLIQEQALLAAKDELIRAADRRNALELDLAKERADRYAEDCLLESREALETRARAVGGGAQGGAGGRRSPRSASRRAPHADRLEREYRKKAVLAAQRGGEALRRQGSADRGPGPEVEGDREALADRLRLLLAELSPRGALSGSVTPVLDGQRAGRERAVTPRPRR